ncbi:hypothetical protein CEP51_010446 [Fusarium floridanum]|uniref:PAS domain-containing protein n=1 Tax=Fusarium floridanum TaxID=1325733 RepID=A0A428REG9_9HYPO|nr:hypothetical protein CEP51_010446 [Fusarium floridanum]
MYSIVTENSENNGQIPARSDSLQSHSIPRNMTPGPVENTPTGGHYPIPMSTKRSFYQDQDDSQSVRDGMVYPREIDTASTASRSVLSYRTHDSPWSQRDASSISSMHIPTTLPALQTKGGMDNDGLEPLREEEYDPASFDLVVPAHALGKQYTLETQSELLFSIKHLKVIFEDPLLLQRFSNFLSSSRPDSLPLLAYYLDTLKALKAIDYANALTGSLKTINGLQFTQDPVTSTINNALRKRADDTFEVMANHDLPAYITHTFIQTVSVTMKRRITDTLSPQLRDLSEGLAEVFCLSDPSRPDNPIVFASEEFHRTTQYGMNYAIGRNCRFLQGPKTNPFSVRRIREKLDAGKEHCETFLNYRRDGSPFMNLLMVAPLYDSRGVVRYHLGAQVDVSGLVKECSGLDSLSRLMQRENPEQYPGEAPVQHHADHNKDEFRELAEMFNLSELKTVRESGGALHRMHQEEVKNSDTMPANWNRPRLVISDDASINRRPSDPILHESVNTYRGGRLSGIFQHYLLVRPYPNLRILFASPSLRVPGMLQSPLLSRIGGSDRVRDTLSHAFADGHGITAKIRWLSRSDMQAQSHHARVMNHESHGEGGGQPPPASRGRSRWIHCTPLQGSNGAIGVWMVVLVDDDSEPSARNTRREAPPVQPYLAPQARQPQEAEGDEDAMSLSSFAAAHRA